MSTKLNADRRERVGTRHSQKLRREGKIPVSVQSEGEKPQVSLSISEEEFLAARRKHEHVYTLTVGDIEQAVLVDELQWDTFGEKIVHVEFRRVDLDKKTEVSVRLEYLGHPKAGLVNHLLNEITVSAKPTDIPDSIEVRVEGLEIGASITAADLTMPEGVDLALDPETPVAAISAPTEEKEPEEETPEEGAPAEGGEAAAAPAPEAKPEE